MGVGATGVCATGVGATGLTSASALCWTGVYFGGGGLLVLAQKWFLLVSGEGMGARDRENGFWNPNIMPCEQYGAKRGVKKVL